MVTVGATLSVSTLTVAVTGAEVCSSESVTVAVKTIGCPSATSPGRSMPYDAVGHGRSVEAREMFWIGCGVKTLSGST